MTIKNTNIRLLSGVPFDINYQHSRLFNNATEQFNYFDSMPRVRSDVHISYRRERDAFRVDLNKEQLNEANYIMYQNTAYGNKWFYAFVTTKDFENIGVTYVNFVIDDWQTYMFDIQFRNSLVEREHLLRYTNNRPTINTIEENINYGTDYDLVFATNGHPTGCNFLVIITNSRLGWSDEVEYSGGIVGVPTSYSYYLLPIGTGGAVWNFDLDGTTTNINGTLRDYLGLISSTEFFANKVVSMFITSYTGINFNVNINTRTVSYRNNANISLSDINATSNITGEDKNYSLIAVNWINSFETASLTIDTDVLSTIQNSYAPFETKLYMSPYFIVELSDMKGNVLTLKPEYLRNYSLSLAIKGSLGTSNKVSYYPEYYNTSVEGSSSFLADNAILDTDPTDVAVITDYAVAMYQGQRNSLLAQQGNIQRNLGFGTANTIFSGAGALATTLINPLAGIANSMGVAQQANNTILQHKNDMSLYNAKIADIENVPPTVSKMGGNASFSIGNFQNNIYTRYKVIKPEYRNLLDNYFKAYGTKTLAFKPVNLNTRRYWNYVKLLDPNITGSISNDAMQRIKNIFMNGITLWHDNDVLNYNRDNTEV